MKRFLVILLAGFLSISFATVVRAAEFGTAAEAEALVKKATALIKTQGAEKAFAEISNPKGKFIDGTSIYLSMT